MIGNAYAAETSVEARVEHAEGDHGPFYATAEFWVAVSFVLFFVIAGKKAWQGLTSALDARAVKISETLEEAKNLRAEAQAALSEYQRKQREAMKDAQAIVDQAKAEAERLKVQAAADLEAALKLRERLAMERIAQAEQRAMAEVRDLAVDVAIAATRTVLKDQLDAGKAGELVDQSIAQLPGKMH